MVQSTILDVGGGQRSPSRDFIIRPTKDLWDPLTRNIARSSFCKTRIAALTHHTGRKVSAVNPGPYDPRKETFENDDGAPLTASFQYRSHDLL